MKLFETNINGAYVGYIVGINNVVSITKKANKIFVACNSEQHGTYEATFDLTKLAFYVIG